MSFKTTLDEEVYLLFKFWERCCHILKNIYIYNITLKK